MADEVTARAVPGSPDQWRCFHSFQYPNRTCDRCGLVVPGSGHYGDPTGTFADKSNTFQAPSGSPTPEERAAALDLPCTCLESPCPCMKAVAAAIRAAVAEERAAFLDLCDSIQPPYGDEEDRYLRNGFDDACAMIADAVQKRPPI